MRVIVNHLTRMKAPRICVAAMEVGSQRHVRPVTPSTNPLTRDLLGENGGPLSVGAVVDLGEVRHKPDPPEVEDHQFYPRRAELLEVLSPEEYLEALHERAGDDLESIFGPELERLDWTYATAEGRGSASLGVLVPQRRLTLEVNDRGRLRLRFNDPDKPAYLPVTDLRFYESDQQTLRADGVEDVAGRLKRRVDAVLMLGLGRPWKDRHWLQVNGICLADRPLG